MGLRLWSTDLLQLMWKIMWYRKSSLFSCKYSTNLLGLMHISASYLIYFETTVYSKLAATDPLWSEPANNAQSHCRPWCFNRCQKSSIIPNTLVGPPPKILFFSPSLEHKNGGSDFSAARPPYRLYLGLWMELNDDCLILYEFCFWIRIFFSYIGVSQKYRDFLQPYSRNRFAKNMKNFLFK